MNTAAESPSSARTKIGLPDPPGSAGIAAVAIATATTTAASLLVVRQA